jgi:CRISPR-associated endonuclease/helicase Cas3
LNNLSPQAKALWGKKSVENGQELWLPLVQHLLDTKNVINWLFYNWLSAGERETMYQDLSEVELKRLVPFLGMIHDFGKATPAFQSKSSRQHDQFLDQHIMKKLFHAGFSSLPSAKLPHKNRSPHALAGEALLENMGLNIYIGAIIGGHHGIPQSEAPVENMESNEYPENYFESADDTSKQKQWKQIQTEILNFCLKESGYTDLKSIPQVHKPTAVILEGLLIMADWLASSEYIDNKEKMPLFPLLPINVELDQIDSQHRFQTAINTWSIYNGSLTLKDISDVEQHYKKRWGFYPRPIQIAMSKDIAKVNNPGIIIIEAPMGIGKTEIALTAVEQVAVKDKENGLFMGLPTQATTNAMFTRVNNWLKQVVKNQKINVSIGLLHGKAKLNEEFTGLPFASNIDDEAATQGAVILNDWFVGKKAILTRFAVGTIDNLLLMGLRQRHLFLRHLAFSGKVVVIDELHAYDSYVGSYLIKTIEWLGAYHVPVIALSATLPISKRNKLIEAYVRGKYGTKKVIDNPNDWRNKRSYPLLTILDGKSIRQYDDFSFNDKDKKVVGITRINSNACEVIELILQSVHNGGIAGIIVNTIKRAQELAKLLPSDVPKIVIHSAFLATDRQKIERKLESFLGKNGTRPDRLIVIGTQVLEQSLDIDFDVLFTDIAPMDLLFQRIGRLHRHNIQRPRSLKNAHTYVMWANTWRNYGKANEMIYSKYLLMKTDYYLPNKLKLPDDISELVQDVYDECTDCEINEIQAAKDEFDINYKNEQHKAKIYQITTPRINRLDSIHGWLDFPSSEESEEQRFMKSATATVRDIKQTIEVVVVKKQFNDFFLLNGRHVEKRFAKEISEQTLQLPRSITFNLQASLKKLRQDTLQNFPEWIDNIWLRNSLVLILDEENQAIWNVQGVKKSFLIKYSTEFGLEVGETDGRRE